MSYLRKSVFILGSDKDTSAMVKLFLESEGHRVKVITGESKEEIDLIFNDNLALYIINEESADGHTTELCRRIRAVDFVNPILICSPSDEKPHIEEAMEAGADDYISTSQDWIKLIDIIGKLTNRYLRCGRRIKTVAGNA
jgi:DNA-binding response OmpR family regulator